MKNVFWWRKRISEKKAFCPKTPLSLAPKSRLDLVHAIIVWADRLIAILRLKLEDGRLYRLNPHGYTTKVCVE